MTTYDGPYPVPEEWVDEHLEDDTVEFVFTIDLEDLIELAGIEAMNEYLDKELSMDLTTLTDIRYFQHPHGNEDALGDLVLIRAEGKLVKFRDHI